MKNITIDLSQKKIIKISDLFNLITLNKNIKDDYGFQKVLYETAIQIYKETKDKKTNTYNQNEKLQLQLNKLKSRVKEAKDLIQIRQRVEFELNKYKEEYLDPQIQNNVKNIRRDRIIKILSIFKSMKPSQNTEKQINNADLFIGKSVIYIAMVIILCTMGFYFYTFNTLLLVGGIIFAFFNVLIFGVINVVGDSKVTKLNFDYANTENKYSEFVKQLNKSENDLLVKSAWGNALQEEYNKVNESIRHLLGGITLEEALEKLELIETDLEQNQKEMNNIIDATFTSEEYLKLRRELDIIEIQSDSAELASDQYNIQLKNFESISDILKNKFKVVAENLPQNINIEMLPLNGVG